MKLFTMLCCINPIGSPEEIDEYAFYQMINPIAPVINIKIFNKESQVKAFVQVESQEVAETVINELNGKQMNIGKIKVFVSHKKFIAFDKSIQQIVANANRETSIPPSIEQPIIKKEEQNVNPYIKNSVTGIKDKFQSYSSWKKDSKIQFVPHNSDKIVSTKDIRLDKDAYKPDLSKDAFNLVYESTRNFVKSKEAPLVKKLKKLSVNTTNKFIKISNFDLKYVNYQMLLNLFGCFGNVSRLMIQPSLGFAVLEYENEKQMERAVKYTDCIRFCGRILNVNPYNNPNIFDETLKKQNPDTFCYNNKPEHYRFDSESAGHFTPPSRVLRISGLPPSIAISLLKTHISQIHQPVKIVTEYNTDSNLTYFLVEFGFIYESFKVLSILHNTEIEGNTLYIDFYKPEK